MGNFAFTVPGKLRLSFKELTNLLSKKKAKKSPTPRLRLQLGGKRPHESTETSVDVSGVTSHDGGASMADEDRMQASNRMRLT